MKQALYVPNYGEILGDPHKVVELAKLAEKANWDGFFVYDHVMEYYKMDNTPKMYDAFSVLSAIAVQTNKIQVGTMVTPINRRRPWVVARQTQTLDHLSKGRFVLGVGIGVKESVEYPNFDEVVDMRQRAEMLDEGLEILQGLWSGKEYNFKGKHYNIKNAKFLPTPINQKKIPIWVAGQWPYKKPFQRAARFNGIVPLKVGFERLTHDEYQELHAFIEAERRDNGNFEYVMLFSSDKNRSDETSELISEYSHRGATMLFSSIAEWFGSEDEIVEYIKAGPRKLIS